MKKVLFLILLTCFVCKINAQMTAKPRVDNFKTTKAYIGAVFLSPELTGIILSVTIDYDGWVRISSKTRIEYNDPRTGQLETKYITRLGDANGRDLSLEQKYTYLPQNIFMLEFPCIPRGVSKINLIEEDNWKWYGINIKPRNDVDVKRMAYSEEGINSLIVNSKNPNAGLYEQLSSTESSPANYRLAFVQGVDGTYLVYVGSTNTVGTWKCGEVKAVLRPTVSNSIYKADWYNGNKTISSAVISFDGATMKVHIDNEDEKIDAIYVKMSGGTNSDDEKTYMDNWSGTGFALKKGYILTNYHVIEDASTINVYGIGGNFKNGVKATVVGSDKLNDLALLKLSGNVPASINTIPYGFKSNIADVGEDVYVLGYPLTATMGEEVKLTNGIISAKTGFEGDVSQYQISVPIQPGNSGGPLIDYNGNVIGVICAKHRGTENVSYAVKVSQVKNLIESVSDLSIISTTNTLRGKSLKDQVKLVNKYVYIIKCSK